MIDFKNDNIYNLAMSRIDVKFKFTTAFFKNNIKATVIVKNFLFHGGNYTQKFVVREYFL